MSGCGEYFDDVAGQWDSMRTEFFSENVRIKACDRAKVGQGDSAADIGAGTGFLTEELLKRGVCVTAVDSSENMLGQLKAKFANIKGFECRVGDAENLPLEAESFDAVLANMCLHHVENPSAAISEMAESLKAGGRLVITDLDEHNSEFLLNEHHDRWAGFKRSDISDWFRSAGLENVEITDMDEICSAESCCGKGRSEVTIFMAYGIKPFPANG